MSAKADVSVVSKDSSTEKANTLEKKGKSTRLQRLQQSRFKNGLTLYGVPPKYGPKATHFDYVNPNAPKGGEVRLAAIGGTFDSLNPFTIKGTPAAGLSPLHPSFLHATLTAHAWDEFFSVYGYVAESMALAPDRASIVFKLRAEATFHDGSPIRPEDVVFTFNILKKKGHPFYRSYFREVLKVAKTGPREVTFYFQDGDNRELPLIIGELPILSEKYFKNRDVQKATLDVPLGSGPYQISEVNPGQSITYKRIKNWWGEKTLVGRGHYNFDEIKYLYFRDDAVALEAFRAGVYDFRPERIAKTWRTGYDFDALHEGHVRKQALETHNTQGVTGFVLNLRRTFFQDRRVRQALNLLFDFEWANKNLFFGLYTRHNSFFSNGDLEAKGLPSPLEQKILKSLPKTGTSAEIISDILTSPFRQPVNDGSGFIRKSMAKALKLLKEAGWHIKEGQLVHQKTGRPFHFEILLVDSGLLRLVQSFTRNLKRVGIEVTIRVVDMAQYQKRLDDFDYDIILAGFPQSESPGNEQREFWGTQFAQAKGGRNLTGIADPMIDAAIEGLVDAPDRQTLVAHTRVLDRLLRWHAPLIMGYYADKIRIAFWHKFGYPEKAPRYQALHFNSWWIDPVREKKLREEK